MRIPANKQYVLFGGTFVLANKLQAVADKTVHGLSTKQWFLLRNLSDLQVNFPPTISLLAKETDTTRQNISKMLEVLQRQGYVILKNSTEDHRSQTVEMTEAGYQILHQIAQQATPFFTELFSDIQTEEYEIAAAVVIKLIAKLNQMQKESV